ncbi:hypothetical protein LOOC260_106680 [Paucilactobacillus hokkaidonensis JCM 18461]|uniref:Polymerase n=3 Tax=Paucilactobacillus hokkaidonensis TaxID=1193095 RepID=A0A0A1GW25_9LACO|nr:hypothetical protein [Paucilactobacillus hokkaidonensis]KRO09554.1 hypothetical protein IV59_GL000515 [Paucilactobacillus hokkaidonensis]BAP85224.1 hypothetical protein LOOC260_106680 [Paucilactobacillus hokkaidonensis JCM 18461]
MEIQKKRLREAINDIITIRVDARSIYFVAFTLYLIVAFLKTTMITDYLSAHILNYGAYFSMGILAFKWLFFSKFTKRQLIIELAVLLFAGLSWLKSGDPLGFYMAALVITARGQNFKEIIKWYVILATVMLALTVILSEVNIIKNLSYLRAAHIRYAFGIVYPTDFASHVFYLMLAYCYLCFHSLNYKYYWGLVIVAGLIYYFADARLDTILILAIIPVMIIAKKKQYDNFDSSGLLNYSWMATGVLAYLAIVAAIFYDSTGPLSPINRLLSSRIALSHSGFTKYGVSIIGQKVKEYGWGGAQGFKNFNVGGQLHQYFMLDSSFVRLLLIYGIVAFLITIVAISYTTLKATQIDNFALVAILLLVALSCLIDQHMLELAYNPFYIAICASIESGSQLKKRVGITL